MKSCAQLNTIDDTRTNWKICAKSCYIIIVFHSHHISDVQNAPCCSRYLHISVERTNIKYHHSTWLNTSQVFMMHKLEIIIEFERIERGNGTRQRAAREFRLRNIDFSDVFIVAIVVSRFLFDSLQSVRMFRFCMCATLNINRKQLHAHTHTFAQLSFIFEQFTLNKQSVVLLFIRSVFV